MTRKRKKILTPEELWRLEENSLAVKLSKKDVELSSKDIEIKILRLKLASKELEDLNRAKAQTEDIEKAKSSKLNEYIKELAKKYKIKGSWSFDDETGEIEDNI